MGLFQTKSEFPSIFFTNVRNFFLWSEANSYSSSKKLYPKKEEISNLKKSGRRVWLTAGQSHALTPAYASTPPWSINWTIDDVSYPSFAAYFKTRYQSTLNANFAGISIFRGYFWQFNISGGKFPKLKISAHHAKRIWSHSKDKIYCRFNYFSLTY